jgi:polyhydroxyalkanoic acid synthase PhaR subunit
MTTPPPEFDPFSPWKPFQNAWMEAWGKAMSETVSSEEFAKNMGQYLDKFLQAATPVRQQTDRAMESYLAQMNLPTQAEVVSLAERLTQLERRADDLDAKADEILDELKALRAALEIKPKTISTSA